MGTVPDGNETAADDRARSGAHITGDNVRRLREERGYSLEQLVSAMKARGYNWNRTTLFNVEHDMRRLQANEAVDMLTALRLDPYHDMPRLMCPDKRTLADRLGETYRAQTRKLIQAARDYTAALDAYVRILDDLKTEKADDESRIETESESMKTIHDATVKLVIVELNDRL